MHKFCNFFFGKGWVIICSKYWRDRLLRKESIGLKPQRKLYTCIIYLSWVFRISIAINIHQRDEGFHRIQNLFNS